MLSELLDMKSILAGIAQPTPLVRAGALGDRAVLKRVHRSHPNFRTINQIGMFRHYFFYLLAGVLL